MNQQFLTELKAVTAENRIFTDEPMKKHTTFRVGGPADILVQPKGTELAAVSYTHLDVYKRQASTKPLNNGCGRFGLDLNSG